MNKLNIIVIMVALISPITVVAVMQLGHNVSVVLNKEPPKPSWILIEEASGHYKEAACYLKFYNHCLQTETLFDDTPLTPEQNCQALSYIQDSCNAEGTYHQ